MAMTCLGIQHLKEALADPCLHCTLLAMFERLLCLAELDPNSAVGLGYANLQSTTFTRKRGASAAAGAPHLKKKAPSHKEHMEETSLSKTGGPFIGDARVETRPSDTSAGGSYLTCNCFTGE